MNILVTGVAGFIGYHLAQRLLQDGFQVYGIDNLNDYYDVSLKKARLSQLQPQSGFTFQYQDLSDRLGMAQLFQEHSFDCVVNLTAQARVRYSLDNPWTYIDSNVTGFVNLLEGCRHNPVKHLVLPPPVLSMEQIQKFLLQSAIVLTIRFLYMLLAKRQTN